MGPSTLVQIISIFLELVLFTLSQFSEQGPAVKVNLMQKNSFTYAVDVLRNGR